MLKASKARIKQIEFMQFQAYEKDCPTCPLKKPCLRNKNQTTPRQVNIKLGVTETKSGSVLEKMKKN